MGVLIILGLIGCNARNDCSYHKPIDININWKFLNLNVAN